MNTYWYLVGISFLCYVLASLASMMRVAGGTVTGSTKSHHYLMVALTACAVLNLIVFGLLKMSLFNSLISWKLLLSIILSVFALVSFFKLKIPSSLTTLNGICLVLVSIDLIQNPLSLQTSPMNLARDFHIIFATLGQGAAIICLLFASLIMYKQRSLKEKTQLLERPPLETLGSVFDLSAQGGLLCFSLALVSGVIFVASQRSAEPTGVKLAWGLSIWMFYLYLMHLKSVQKTPLQGRIKIALWGLCSLEAIYLLVHFRL